MEITEPPPDWAALLARHRAELEAQLRACDLSLVGLAEPAPVPRMLGDTVALDGTVRSVGLCYGDPMLAEGPLVQVRTGRDVPPPDLREVIQGEQDRVGDASLVDEHPSPGTLAIDGDLHDAELLHAGTRFWAGLCRYRGGHVVVVARDWALPATRLATVTDAGPFLQGSQDYLARLRAAEEPAVAGPEAVVGPRAVDNPHRALVEAALEQSRQIEARVRSGRRPRVSTTGDGPLARMPGLWEAATRAQMRFADQDRREAAAAITALVNQLVALQEQAGWFAEDALLREAAITECLQYWTGLREAVPSRAAQEAWRRVWTGGQAPRSQWLAAWAEWARAHR